MDGYDRGPERASATATGSHRIVPDKPRALNKGHVVLVILLSAIIGICLAGTGYVIISSNMRVHNIETRICQDNVIDRHIDSEIAQKINLPIHFPPPAKGC